MTEIADRYRKLADVFTARVEAVAPDAWDNPAPCEGWVARDVVRHLTEWVPGLFFTTWGIDYTPAAAVDDDPVAAWRGLDGAVRAALADPAVAGAERDNPMGRTTLAQVIDMIMTPDVLVHTWDLARATGQDERLDADEVRALLRNMEPMDEPMRASGHFGPRVPVPDDADDQTKLIAFTGRQP